MNSKISTWLYRIAVNTSLDHIRKHNRQERKNKLLIFLGFKTESHIISKDPLVELVKKEQAIMLMKAIDTLPEKQKTAWVLTTSGGMSGREAAEIMDISISAIESLKYRAKGRLKKILKKYYLINESEKKRTDNE